MSSASSIDLAPAASASARPFQPSRPSRASAGKTVTIGLLGFGNVGQAVAQLAENDRLLHRGWRLRIGGALVRDVTRPRRAHAAVTADVAAFLRGRYDVVIDALAGEEPARTLVARLLGQGVPVVTANKALVAAHGRGLAALAALRGTSFRYEASALAGVPFLGALAARPFVADFDRCTAVVNGSSNFILSKIEAGAYTLDAALDTARHLGLTEPDPSRNLDGFDGPAEVAAYNSFARTCRPSQAASSARTRSSPSWVPAGWARSIVPTTRSSVATSR
jgi:homoserine dehydrogenase